MPDMQKGLKPQHTPGPWTAYEFGYGNWYVAFPDDDSGPAITVHSWPEHREANARLIAAAPELLEALKVLAEDARQAIADYGPCDHAVNICVCAEREHVEQAEAAIAKAEGR